MKSFVYICIVYVHCMFNFITVVVAGVGGCGGGGSRWNLAAGRVSQHGHLQFPGLPGAACAGGLSG